MAYYLDVSAAVHSRAGLGRYAASLATHLDDLCPKALRLFYNRDNSIQPLANLAHLPARTVHAGYKPWRMAVWLGQLAGIGFDRLLPDAQLYHATEHLLMPLKRCPTVLTIHDLIYKLYPQHHKRLNYWYLNAAMPLYARRADAIITISEATKRDLVAHYGVPADKVTVIYEAADPRFCPAPTARIARVKAVYGLPARYILHVGTIEPRKNLTRLLRAIELLRAQGEDVTLVIVGSKGWLFEGFFQALEASPARDAVILPGYVQDEDLVPMYSGAEMVVMSSVYEGFGLPILEGMACGVPVASSNASSMPELGGDAAAYFDPENVEEMAQVIGRIWRDRDLAQDMIERGLAQASRFSWRQTAEQTLKLYRNTIAQKSR